MSHARLAGLRLESVHAGQWSFVVSQTFRGWPLKWSRQNAALHVLLAVLHAYIMRVYPAPLVTQGDANWAESFADFRYVPLLTILLGYGPLWTLLTALLMLVPDLLLGVLTHQPNLLVAPLLATVGVVAVGALVIPPLNIMHFPWRQTWWRLPLTLLPVGLPFLLSPGGLSGVWAALLLVLSNLIGFVAGAAVNRSRFRLLAVTSRLSKQAHTDSLTGLWNRRQFERDLAALAAGGWVLVIDLDHFKTINDRFGHDVGDEYLVGAAAALNRAGPRAERAYRLGGEEFALLLPAAHSPEQSMAVAQDILAHVSEVNHRSNPGGPLTCSVGVAQRQASETPHAALRRADLALFRAKAGGRNRAELAADTLSADDVLMPGAPAEPPQAHTLEPLFWEALHSSIRLAAIDRDLSDAEWTRLLQLTLLNVPNAELGSIDVREGEFFVQRAQVGYSSELIGLRYSEQEQLYWYGLGEEAWRRGQARMLSGQDIVLRSSMPVPGDSHFEDFERSGRIHELKVNLCLPLLMDGEVVAHLNLDRISDSRPFDEQDMRIARAFADQMTVLTVAARRRAAFRQWASSSP